MRSTADLIQELDKEAKKFWFCSIAVGFEASTIFVSSSQEDRLQLLSEAVEHGGEPIGMIAVIKAAEKSFTDACFEKLTLCQKVFAEYAEEEWASKYLGKLVEVFAQSLGRQTFDQGEWLN